VTRTLHCFHDCFFALDYIYWDTAEQGWVVLIDRYLATIILRHNRNPITHSRYTKITRMLVRHEVWTVASALLPSVSAFYPYHYGDSSKGYSASDAVTPYTTSQHASDVNDRRRTVTLPLQRVSLSSRQNSYNIINSGDPKQENSVAVDQDGNDLSYMVAVTIGSSKEEYHLLLDSAASNTWVMGQECTTDACKRHNTFGEGDSDSLKVRLDGSLR
jgi:hypothetical protein